MTPPLGGVKKKGPPPPPQKYLFVEFLLARVVVASLWDLHVAARLGFVCCSFFFLIYLLFPPLG
jgi:hypothetical protein